jgi:hypothetical protein
MANPIAVPITEVSRHFSDFVNRVVYCKERFTLIRGNKPIARLEPELKGCTLRDLPAMIAALPRLSDDEMLDFSQDIEKSRVTLDTKVEQSPWDM